MGRLHHLKQTLPRNLSDNSDHKDLEIVILDYNSKDGLEDWIRSHAEEWISSGKVSYWKESAADRWRMPQAKNLAALVSTGDVVCNLDADNFTGTGYVSMLSDIFSSMPKALVVHFQGGGFGGRLALSRKEFMELRGYDEALSYGWGCEDDDLKQRALSNGCVMIKTNAPDDGIVAHDDEKRLKFMPEWKDIRSAHEAQSIVFEKRIPKGVINPEGFGMAELRNLDGSKRLYGMK